MADTYVPVTFVADELLTSTKMNLLGANQAGFHSGEAMGDGIIVTRHLSNATKVMVLPSVTGSVTAPESADSTNDFKCPIPSDYVDGTAITVKYMRNASNATGVVNQRGSVFNLRNGVSSSVLADSVGLDFTASGAFVRDIATIYTTGTDEFDIGDVIFVRIARDTADTSSASVDYDAVWIEYTGSV